MSALSIQVPFPVFQDRDGQPLDNGYVWLGTSSLNPQTNPVVAYYDSALTIVATQPLRTLNGFISRAGSPAQVYVDAVNFSILVQDRQGTTVFSVPEGTGISPNASGVVYDPAGTGAVATTVQTQLRNLQSLTVKVKDHGATGDGSTNDTVAIQAAIDSIAVSGGVITFPPGVYRVARNIGTNDRWGIKVTASNITLQGAKATLRRYNTDISTYALAYPILFVGVPDSDIAAATENITIDGLLFQGEDTRHSTSGSSLTDFRDAIVFKNTSGTLVNNCLFTAIDSQAITYQQPAAYDYAGSVYYNRTKNYNSKITGCSFVANSHATVERALIHAIVPSGIDFCTIADNYFEWCDDCVAGETTYNRFTDIETDTFTYTGAASALGAVKRSGRNIAINGNTILNSSEHAIYPAFMDVTVVGNNIRTDAPTICTGDQIKIRSRGATCSGNVISNHLRAISVTEPSMNVTVSGNVCTSPGTLDGGVIDIDSAGLSTYISDRVFFYSGGTPDYQAMCNISVTGNVVNQPNTAAGSATQHISFRISTELTADANYPNGQIQGINICGNTSTGHNVGVYVAGSGFRAAVISGNSFYAKSFTQSGFSGATTLNTRAVLQTIQGGDGSLLLGLGRISFAGNYISGATYLFSTNTASGSAGTYELPWGIVGNRFDYVKNIKTADVQDIAAYTRFSENTGDYFLDRTTQLYAIGNSLGNGTTSASSLRYCFLYDGANLRFYTNDTSTYLTL